MVFVIQQQKIYHFSLKPKLSSLFLERTEAVENRNRVWHKLHSCYNNPVILQCNTSKEKKNPMNCSHEVSLMQNKTKQNLPAVFLMISQLLQL